VVRRMRPRPLTTRPSVSVVVPCYNYGHFLPALVADVLAQPGVDVDLIIVDDASPDGSADIARTLAAADPRVRVLAHNTNLRHIATYNDGLRAATGDYVVLLSADDLLAPGSLQRATALLEARPEMAFVYGYAPDFTDVPPQARTEPSSWSVWAGDEWLRRLCRRGNNVVVNPEVVMRRSVMDRLGGYDPDLPQGADLYLWMRAALLGSVGRINGCDQAFYRVHGANMHLTQYAGVMADITERRRAHEKLFAEDLATHPRRTQLSVAARRAVAREAVQWGCRAHDQGELGWRTSMQAYEQVALDAWPPIVRTTLWRSFQRRLDDRSYSLERAAAAAVWTVRHALRWRRWRRFGT
jgi:hypothetical protein